MSVVPPTALDPDGLIGEVLVDPAPLARRVAELGGELSRDYADRDLLLVGVLKGAVFFMADLVRSITVPVEIDFMAVSSYGSGTDSSGVVRILKDLDANIEGRHVVIVEDIVDSGLTLSYLVRSLEARSPATLEVCALLTKPERRKADIECRYVGFEIPNRFAIGYGLDYTRALPEPAVRCGAGRIQDPGRPALTAGFKPAGGAADRPGEAGRKGSGKQASKRARGKVQRSRSGR